jgi:hypothetical protein
MNPEKARFALYRSGLLRFLEDGWREDGKTRPPAKSGPTNH